MRAFIAIDISDRVRSAIDKVTSELREVARDARWVSRENLHLTLRFLGRSDEKILEAMSRELDGAAERVRTFTLCFRGMGFFPSSRRPRVLWIGVPEPPQELLELQQQLEEAARKLGFRPEERRFAPHLTVARFRTTRPQPELALLVDRFRDYRFGDARVGALTLFQSHLRPRGAVYEMLACSPFKERGSRL
ncbi:MAG: RNA 2',3'-cyclic phosphodiesterase [Acidobacteriota bacterium]